MIEAGVENTMGQLYGEAEMAHAKLWFEALGGVGTTQENLKHAAEGENYEYTEMYKEFAEVAKPTVAVSHQRQSSGNIRHGQFAREDSQRIVVGVASSKGDGTHRVGCRALARELDRTRAQTQATLRFGHEVCVMPLACLLELDNCAVQVENLDELDQYWQNYKIFPMGCNIQLIFYRPKKNKEGDILVKALLNEREAKMPVATDQYPYYKWSDLRQYYLDKLAKFDALNSQK